MFNKLSVMKGGGEVGSILVYLLRHDANPGLKEGRFKKKKKQARVLIGL